MNAHKGIVKFLTLVLLVTTLTSALTTPAQAATNGQQISVYACNANRVILQGYNQNGSWATYTLNKSSSNCGWYNITGWWWKGTVTLNVYYYVSVEYPYYKGQTRSVYVPVSSSSNWVYATIPTPGQRQWISWRAQTWVNDHVPYNQNGRRDGYRQDCSGYVSFAWQLPAPGPSTSSMSSYANSISYDSLQPGDALNNSGSHIILFMGWVNQSTGAFTGYEENGTYGTRSATLTINKLTGVIKSGSYTYPGTYKAIRKSGL